jgi:hypothetical protein
MTEIITQAVLAVPPMRSALRQQVLSCENSFWDTFALWYESHQHSCPTVAINRST